ncbi:uncharacterized protein LOC133792185 [Humulus lupulus]|uniref:uncharacterized protein LOC133792185 n=1 Tax=Humulus lupulus TaxID=3486 RepID=UPI002B413DDC|nr:uncharacterized protein LOC133792185 [Humulus lupulus]
MARTSIGGAPHIGSGSQNVSNDATMSTDTNRFSTLDQPSYSSTDDAQNPYFLAHSDHHGANLVPKILTGCENYSSWKRSMTVALLSRNKLKFVNGQITQPDPDDDDYDAWSRCNSMVISWILHAISSDIVDSIMYLDDASAICSELHDRFHQNNGPRVFEVKRSMQVLTQGNHTVQAYFTHLKVLWDLVQEFRPQPVCTCGAMKTIVAYQEQDQVLELLVGLNESYSAARSQILMQDPLPPINKVYVAIIQEERQRGLHSVSSDSVDSSSSSTQFIGSIQSARPKVVCSHCGITGHTINKCYKLHGYPPGHKLHGKGRGSTSHSGKVVVNHFNGSAAAKVPDTLDNNTNLVSSLSSSQCQKIIALLAQQVQASSSTAPPSPSDQSLVSNFVGATHHVCHDLSLFSNTYFNASLTSVILPIGQSANVPCVDYVSISSDITLFNVLYVPSFNHHLLFDTTRTRQIGMGERVGNLYYLADSSYVHASGPFHTLTVEGHRFFITLVDDCSRYTWVHFIKQKSEAQQVIPAFISLIKTQYNIQLKAIWSDNAKELQFPQLFSSLGIMHYHSCVDRPQQNFVVERKHQHLLNVARALLFQSHIPLVYWAECLSTATYLIIRTPTPNFQCKSPFEVLHNKTPTYNHLKAFGCLAYASTFKFSSRATSCVFLGYPMGMKGYKLLDLDTNRVFVSRDVQFHEHIFPYASSTSLSSDYAHFFSSSLLPLCDVSTDLSDASNLISSFTPLVSNHQPSSSSSRPTRNSKRPSYLNDYHCSLSANALSFSSQSISQVTQHPLSQVLTYSRLSPSIRACVLAVSSCTEPEFFSQATGIPE